MRKMKLDLESLSVESFDTGDVGGLKGTVFAKSSENTACGPGDEDDASRVYISHCWGQTCNGPSCVNTCPPTACQTCANTCYHTCGPQQDSCWVSCRYSDCAGEYTCAAADRTCIYGCITYTQRP